MNTLPPTDGVTSSGISRAVERGGALRGLRVVASSTLLSRVLGMIRDMATAHLFGLTPVMDAFAFAFRIPNLARRLFGEGALSAAFLPVFARTLAQSAQQPHLPWQLATAVFTALTVLLSAAVLVGEGVLWTLLTAAEPGSPDRLLYGLTLVMLPYAVLICLAAQVTAVLHALGHFTWPALLPVVLNTCLLATIWFVDPLFEPDRPKQAYALAVCVLVSGVLQLLLQIPTLLRLGYRPAWCWPATRESVREIGAAVLPVTLGLSVTQINTLLDSVIAWCFSGEHAQPGSGGWSNWWPEGLPYPLRPGAVSALYYAERVYQFPLGVFGVALGTVLFPLLARHAADRNWLRLREDLTLGLRLVLAIGLPASAGLWLVARPLVAALFQQGAFGADQAERTAELVGAYATGVWCYCAIPILYRAFYAMGERGVPVRVGLLAVACDLGLNLTLIWPLAERSLAWTTALTAGLQVCLLTSQLQRRLGRLDWPRLKSTFARSLAATLVMSLTVVAALHTADAMLGTGRSADVWRLCIGVSVGMLMFAGAALVLKLDEVWVVLGIGPGDRDKGDIQLK